ncbi:MAG: hypothetical protein HY217_09095, partial [Candidatus Rokubacteria bacterium]|nr:hypothetical protein [Candidatus Rokubacteria bacterium]
MREARVLAVVLLAILAGAAGLSSAAGPRGVDAPFDHVIVLFLENRSFDHLFGTYPGADGLASYTGKQTDRGGKISPALPPPAGR